MSVVETTAAPPVEDVKVDAAAATTDVPAEPVVRHLTIPVVASAHSFMTQATETPKEVPVVLVIMSLLRRFIFSQEPVPAAPDSTAPEASTAPAATEEAAKEEVKEEAKAAEDKVLMPLTPHCLRLTGIFF